MKFEVEHSENIAQLVDELDVYVSSLPLTDEQADELSRRFLEVIDTAEEEAFAQGADFGMRRRE